MKRINDGNPCCRMAGLAETGSALELVRKNVRHPRFSEFLGGFMFNISRCRNLQNELGIIIFLTYCKEP